MSREQYFAMCEQMGWEPKDSEVPVDIENLSTNSQMAYFLFSILPDVIAGLDGTWIGKDLSGLRDIMQIYEVDEEREVLDLLLLCIRETQNYEIERKKREKK